MEKIIKLREDFSFFLHKKILFISKKNKEMKLKLKKFGINYSYKNSKLILNFSDVSSINLGYMKTLEKVFKNIYQGIDHGFKKTLIVRKTHFPIRIHINRKELVVKNIFGKKKPIILKIPKDIQIKLESQNSNILTISSMNLMLLGNFLNFIIDKLKMNRFDKRVYQDGIYEYISDE